MKLRALDQFHISAVKSDALSPGEEFAIEDAAGAALLSAHPTVFEMLPETPEQKADVEPANKAAPRLLNKAARPKGKSAAPRKKPAAK